MLIPHENIIIMLDEDIYLKTINNSSDTVCAAIELHELNFTSIKPTLDYTIRFEFNSVAET